jgi:23S rRNA (cytosine1962-C5)-methyltransferase
MSEYNACAILRRGKDRLPRSHHPWIFSGAIARIEGSPGKGDVISVLDSAGNFVAQGFFNPDSSTPVRLVSWSQAESVDTEWWIDRVHRSFVSRGKLLQEDGVRGVYGEADGLPGLVVDFYGPYAVVQITTAAVDLRKDLVVLAIQEASSRTGRPLSGIYERSDSEVRRLERLEQVSGLLWGEEPPDLVEIVDQGIKIGCSIRSGQKGGFYFDQRFNRARVAAYAEGKLVLDAFSYSGAFSLHATRAGARELTLLESSADALLAAERDRVANGMSGAAWELDRGDVFQKLREYRSAKRSFDLIILDPPKLATTRAGIEVALRGYKDLNLSALRLISEGGILASFSCSGRISRDQFRTAIAWAAKDAGREVRILETLSQGPDHPIRLSFPESEYLKGYILQVM